MKLTYSASSIASLIGYNIYTNKDTDKKIDILFKVFYDNFKPDDIEYKNSDDLFNELIVNDLDLKNMISEYSNINIENPKQLEKIIETFNEFINVNSYSEDDIEIIKKYISKKFTLQYGTFCEDKTIVELEKEGITVLENNAKTYNKEYMQFKVKGHIDGYALINNVKTLIEIKNRKSKLFKHIPVYEEVQMLFYMHMVGFKKGILVEQYGDKIHKNLYNTINTFLYHDCISRLEILTEFLNMLNEIKEIRDEIFIKKNEEILTMYLYWFY